MDCNYLNREIKAIVFNRDIIFIFLLYKYSIPSKNILYILSRSIRTNSFFSISRVPFFLISIRLFAYIVQFAPTWEACANLIVRSRSISTTSLQILQE